MERQEIVVRAPGSFVLVGGAVEVDAPMLEDGPSRLSASDQCVCIGTLCEVDGSTRLVVGSGLDRSGLTLAFSGEVDTPSGRLVVSDAELNSLIDVAAPSGRTGLSVWTNDPREPTAIAIEVTGR